MARRPDGIPRTLLRLSTTDGVTYRYELECGHVISGPGRATVPAMMKCPECAKANSAQEALEVIGAV